MPTRLVTPLPGVIEKPVANGSWESSRSPIDRIIIHTMVGTLDGSAQWFNNPNRESLTSAHYGIGLKGQLYHFTDEDNTAYHAGNKTMNLRSIGIEHEDMGDPSIIRTDVLYSTSAKLVADICKFYNISPDRKHILMHREVSSTQCPGTLDIDRIVREAKAILTPPAPTPMPFTFTNQTKIPLGPPDGEVELGAVKSMIHDLRRDYAGAMAQAGDLKAQLNEATRELKDCMLRHSAQPQNGLESGDSTIPNPSPRPSQFRQILDLIREVFKLGR